MTIALQGSPEPLFVLLPFQQLLASRQTNFCCFLNTPFIASTHLSRKSLKNFH